MALGTATASLAAEAAATAGTAFEAVTPAVAAADAAATVGGVSTLATVPTLGSLASAAMIGSSLVSGLGSIRQSQASAASAGYNAKIQAQNAQIQTQNAQFAGAEGEANTAAAGAKTRAEVGAIAASQGASGVDINSGSSVDVRESGAKIGMLNALNIRSQAARSAYGYQTSAASDQAQAALLRKQQSEDKTAGYLSAGASVLGGVGGAAKYTDWLNSGGL